MVMQSATSSVVLLADVLSLEAIQTVEQVQAVRPAKAHHWRQRPRCLQRCSSRLQRHRSMFNLMLDCSETQAVPLESRGRHGRCLWPSRFRLQEFKIQGLNSGIGEQSHDPKPSSTYHEAIQQPEAEFDLLRDNFDLNEARPARSPISPLL